MERRKFTTFMALIMKRKQKLAEERTKVMKALAHPIRIFWVDLIAINYLSVSGERSSSNGCLYCFKAFNPAETGLNIDRPEDGIRVLYSLICPCIMEFIHCIDDEI
ncbi:MAG: hypothetical protein PQJ50_06650 [Spirochaetales bacterium]|nr:hypothetical protein [Spirochaetales bacterium]